jgi:hypothetical protein
LYSPPRHVAPLVAPVRLPSISSVRRQDAVTPPSLCSGLRRRRIFPNRLMLAARRGRRNAPVTTLDLDGWVTDEDARMREMRARGYPQVDPLMNSVKEESQYIEPVKAAWSITERIVEEIVTRCQQRSIPVVAVVIPFQFRIKNAQADYDYWSYPEKRFSRLFQRLGTPAVMMMDHFDADGDWYYALPVGHLNPDGHRVTAEAIFETLKEAQSIDAEG